MILSHTISNHFVFCCLYNCFFSVQIPHIISETSIWQVHIQNMISQRRLTIFNPILGQNNVLGYEYEL